MTRNTKPGTVTNNSNPISEIIITHFCDIYDLFAIFLRTEKERQNISGF